MDWQAAFNVISGVALMLFGAMLKAIYDAVAELRREDSGLHERITAVVMTLPETYARRDDMREIREALVRIETKLDQKADK